MKISYLEWEFDLTQNSIWGFQNSFEKWQLNLGAIAFFAEFRNKASSGKQSEKFEHVLFVCSKYGKQESNKNGDDSFFGFHQSRRLRELENLSFVSWCFERCGSFYKDSAGFDICNDDFKEWCGVDWEDEECFVNSDRCKEETEVKPWVRTENTTVFAYRKYTRDKCFPENQLWSN